MESDNQNNDGQNHDGSILSEEPLEVKIFYPDDVILIDSRHLERHIPRHRYTGPRQRPFLALGLFIATCLSTFFMGMVFFSNDINDSGLPAFSEVNVKNGLTYSIAVMSILLFHEMGHFLQSRRYKIPASYPYFIPMPLNPFGTMGAVILQGSGVANRKSLFDVAISGPLAGLVVALPCLIIGIKNAQVIEFDSDQAGIIFGNPLLIDWIADWYHGVPPGFILELNPLLFAGWVGIFITALNLIPIGQLDGGHILYTLIGKRAHLVAKFMLFAAVGMMFITQKPTYLLMIFLLYMMGTKHPPTEDDSVPLGKGRIILGWLTLAFIFIGFTTDPLLDPDEMTPKKTEKEEDLKLVKLFNVKNASINLNERFRYLPAEYNGSPASPDELGKSYLSSSPDK
jgi:membrane-associated protease RseP (regulator of RpoE activity)